MDYTIVKVYITERKDVMKYHSNAITAWQTSAMTVTALLKIHVRKSKVFKKKNLSLV